MGPAVKRAYLFADQGPMAVPFDVSADGKPPVRIVASCGDWLRRVCIKCINLNSEPWLVRLARFGRAGSISGPGGTFRDRTN